MSQYVVRLSVCLSATFRYVFFHTDWNTSKIISRFISLRYWLGLILTSAIRSHGNTPKIRVEYEWGQFLSRKPAISLKRGKIGPRLLWRTNRKSHTRFRLLPKSMTLDDLERLKRHSCRKDAFTESTTCDSKWFLYWFQK